MRRVKFYVILGILLVAQLVFVPRTAFYGYPPDLMLVGLVVLSMMAGPLEALMHGMVLGLLYDVMVGIPVGMMLIIYSAVSVVPAFFMHYKRYQEWYYVFAYVALLSLVKESILLGYVFLSGAYIDSSIFQFVLWRILWNTLLCLPIFGACALILYKKKDKAIQISR